MIWQDDRWGRQWAPTRSTLNHSHCHSLLLFIVVLRKNNPENFRESAGRVCWIGGQGKMWTQAIVAIFQSGRPRQQTKQDPQQSGSNTCCRAFIWTYKIKLHWCCMYERPCGSEKSTEATAIKFHNIHHGWWLLRCEEWQKQANNVVGHAGAYVFCWIIICRRINISLSCC